MGSRALEEGVTEADEHIEERDEAQGNGFFVMQEEEEEEEEVNEPSETKEEDKDVKVKIETTETLSLLREEPQVSGLPSLPLLDRRQATPEAEDQMALSAIADAFVDLPIARRQCTPEAGAPSAMGTPARVKTEVKTEADDERATREQVLAMPIPQELQETYKLALLLMNHDVNSKQAIAATTVAEQMEKSEEEVRAMVDTCNRCRSYFSLRWEVDAGSQRSTIWMDT